MKKQHFIFLAALLIAVSIFGQSPEKISYQAVVRDAANATVANQVVGMKISILQDGTLENPGSAVYVETQTPTTNANGLLSIYIGAGSAVTGTFSGIAWSNVPHYIKIEIDPSGNNTNYTITGTTQLVSVPFALYAKTAGDDVLKENTANKSTDFVTDAASDVKFPSVKSVKTYVDAVQDDVDANEATSTTSDATLQGYIDALEARITVIESQPIAAAIGDLREGGGVIWVDPIDNTHGLVCALSDEATQVEWGCHNFDIRYVPNVPFNGGNPVGLGAEIGYGDTNTNAILNDCPSAPAALAARSLGPEWFLPSVEELNQMYIHKTTLEAVSGFSAFSNYYWSSTEGNTRNAWGRYFTNGHQFYDNKSSTEDYSVRAVRAF
jgi:hypothetical protein